ncbi:hypothetical protein TSUD_289610 [Trifolium subterraneum]|uniref:Uncharacterized protein n=1 Tax=Trifolium subterraneum TaxID=3900 RepID=A0A2Z6MM00_TRISU|nr:hypothetical protein TSUD_289610 [Trifolium subterraneum]
MLEPPNPSSMLCYSETQPSPTHNLSPAGAGRCEVVADDAEEVDTDDAEVVVLLLPVLHVL